MISLLFERPIQKSIGGVEIDAFVNETFDFTSDVTSHAVESGQDVSDHIRNKPDEISVTGIIGSNSGFFDAGLNRKNDVYNQLREIHKNEIPVDIVTGLDVFNSMGLTALKIDRNVSNANGLSFIARFKKVQVVASERVDLGELADPEVQRAASAKQNAGRQTTEAASPADESRASILFNVFG